MMRPTLPTVARWPKTTRATPIATANDSEAEEVTVILSKPSPAWANADAHWLVACSDAPAASMMPTNNQNAPRRNRST